MEEVMNNVRAEQLLTTLKQHLKAQKITYAELAKRCNLHERTLKRQLTRPHIPLDQLLLLCQHAGISMATLLKRSQESRKDIIISGTGTFRQALKCLLAANIKHYSYR